MPERVAQLILLFRRTYPDAHCELNYRNAFELLVATILSAQSNDKQVNILTANLFSKYKTPQDYVRVPPAELQEDLKTIGLFRNKAKSIQACCHSLIEQHGGEVPSKMEALVELAGVGRKTANVVLGNAFYINEGIVVDTHVARLSARLGLSEQSDPVKIEQELVGLVPKKHWTLFSHWLIWHGRRRCFARKPDCLNCEVRMLCPSFGVIEHAVAPAEKKEAGTKR